MVWLKTETKTANKTTKFHKENEGLAHLPLFSYTLLTVPTLFMTEIKVFWRLESDGIHRLLS